MTASTRRHAAAGATLVACVALLTLTACAVLVDVDRHLRLDLNADVTFFFNIYQDLFRDGFPLFGWSFPAAPNVFPDVALFFPLLALLGDWGTAFATYFVLHLVAFYGAAVALGLALRPGALRAWLLPAVTLAFFAVYGSRLFFYWLFPGMHGDVMLGFLLGAAVAVQGGDRPLRGWEQALYVVTATLMGASDYLFLPATLVPLAIAAAFDAWHLRPGARRPRQIVEASIVAAVATFALRAGVDRLELVTISPPDFALKGVPSVVASLVNVPESLRVAAAAAPAVAVAATITTLAMLVLVTQALTRRGTAIALDPARCKLIYLATACVAAVPTVYAALVAGGFLAGSPVDPYKLRYYQSLLVLPPVIGAVALLGVASRRLLRIEAALALGVAAAAAAHAPTLSRQLAQARIAGIYPPLVECVDRIARERGLSAGYGDFNSQHLMHAFSRASVRLRWMRMDLLWASSWASDRLWGLRRDDDGTFRPSRPTFAVTGDPDGYIRRFGEPAARSRCGGSDVLVYDRPGDVAFRNAYRGGLEWQVAGPGGLGGVAPLDGPRPARASGFRDRLGEGMTVRDVPPGGLSLDFGVAQRKPVLDLATRRRGALAVDYLLGDVVVATQTLAATGEDELQRDVVATPFFATGRAFDQVVLKPLSPERVGFAYALLFDDADQSPVRTAGGRSLTRRARFAASGGETPERDRRR
jgi:hypothetical protein